MRLAFNGETTKGIAVTAAAATVEAALEELGGIDNVIVTKSGNTWTIRFTGNLSNTDVSVMQGDAKLNANGTLLQTMISVPFSRPDTSSPWQVLPPQDRESRLRLAFEKVQ